MGDETITPFAPQEGDSDLMLRKRIGAALAAISGSKPLLCAFAALKCTTHGTGGTAKAFSSTPILARIAIVRAADTGNTATITIGPNTDADYAPLAAGGGEYVIPVPPGGQVDLAAWYSLSTAAAQSFQVLYVA